MKLKSCLMLVAGAFLFCGCVGGLNKNAGYEVGAVYETVVPIWIQPDQNLPFVYASHDSHLPENLIRLRKKYGGNFRGETVQPRLRFKIDRVSLVVLDSTWGMHDSIEAKLLNGEYSGCGFFLEKISHPEKNLFGIMRWHPDLSIVRRIE